MKNLGELLIQSLHDAVAFEEGKLDARIKVGELTLHKANSDKTWKSCSGRSISTPSPTPTEPHIKATP